MTKKSLLTVLISILTLTALVLTACSSASVATLEISEDSEFKTHYVVGEELDINGIKLVIGLTDETSRTVNATDIRSELKITGFDTSVPHESLSVILAYKGATASYNITVVGSDDDTQKCKVTFETGEGSAIEDVYVLAYSFISVPEDPEREGYIFDGWYKEKTYNNSWNFNTDKIVDDTVLYAKWAKRYTVTFIDEVNGVEDIVRYVKEGATLTDVPTLPTRDGEYGEWDRQVFTDIHSDIIVHSVYTPRTYTVRFVYLDSDGKTQIEIGSFTGVTHGEDLGVTQAERINEIVSTSVPEYNADGNKHFAGWDTSFNHIVSDLTVTAVYVLNSYEVTFDLNYQTEDTVYAISDGVTHGNAVSAPAVNPAREGYEFDGWYRQAECVKAWDFTADRVTGAVRLYAKWTKLVYVRYLIPSDVTIDAETDTESPVTLDTYVLTEGGIPVTYKLYYVSAVRLGGNAQKPAVPERHGYRGSWGIDDVVLQNVQNDIPVKVSYQIITDYKVKFYNYDRTLLSEQEVTFRESAVVPETEPTRTGYVFTGWDKDFTSIDSDLEVTAQYRAGVYKVKCYPNNGQENKIVEVACDSRIELGQTLKYENYSFKGWYTDASFGECFDISASLLNPEYTVGKAEGEIVLELHAKWLRIYKMYFYDEDGNQSSVEDVESGATLKEIPSIANKTGYTGTWYEKDAEGKFVDTAYNFDAPVYGIVRLYPKYTINTYSVKFYVDNEIFMATDVDHGKYVTVQIPDPQIEGRTFKGWDKDIESTMIVEDTDFTALFETITFTVTWGDGLGITSIVDYGNAAIFPVTATAPTQRGYTLSGWKVVSPSDGDMTSVKADMVLEPVFKANDYSITFKDRDTNASFTSNAGSLITKAQYGTFIRFGGSGVIDNPQKEGYTFTGWQAGLITLSYSDGWYLVGSSDAEQISKELPGSLVISDGTYYYLEASSDELSNSGWETNIPKLTLEDDGKWHYGSTSISATKLVFDKVYYCVREDVTFLATFMVSEYTVKYVTNIEGLEIADVVLQYGAVLQAPQAPVADEKVFLGWYSDKGLTTRFYFDGKTASENLTLYAKWETQTSSSEGLDYTLSSDGESYALTGISELNSEVTSIQVANYHNGKPVTAIGVEAFAGAKNIVSIELPNTLESIGPKAFMGCTKLTEIEIPASVKVIPDNAFNGCTSLTTVTFRQGAILQTIGKSAFSGATALESFTLPSTVTAIEAGAFHNATSLVSMVIPASVTDIGDRAFAGADNLRYVKFERNIPCNLGSDVFLNTTALSKAFRIYVYNTVAYSATSAGENWAKLSSAITSASLIDTDGKWSYRVTARGAELVQYLGNETEIEIPTYIVTADNGSQAVYGLGDYVFDTGITLVAMASTQSISANTFGSATGLLTIKITVSGSSGYSVNADYLRNAYNQCPELDTLYLDGMSFALAEIFGGDAPTALKKVILEGSEIKTDMLANSAYITEVVVKGASSIGKRAFINCTALKKVTFDASVETIGESAFEGCISLGANGFVVITSEGNSTITTIGLPSTITTIGANAFEGTGWLNNNNDDLVIIGDGILYTYQGTASVVYIPASVKNITAYAFANSQKLTRVVVENPTGSAMTTINEYAFSNCVRLESVIIPANVTKIGAYAFDGCTKLMTVALFNKTDNGTEIDSNAFNGVPENVRYYAEDGNEEAYNNYNDGSRKGKIIKVTQMNVALNSSNQSEKWLYSSINASNCLLIKFVGDSDTVEVPTSVNNLTVAQIADYAFTRSMTSLSYGARVKGYNNTVSSAIFGGVTELDSLTIKAGSGIEASLPGIEASLLGDLIEANTKLTAVSITSEYAIQELIGGVLPSHIKTVNILADETKIADNFLKDCASVESITITISNTEDGTQTVYDLKDTKEVSNSKIETIGAKAFAGTAWMDNYPDDYIVILNGNLVDYKGKNSILSIPETVKIINASVFKDDTFIEIVTIPASVTQIGDSAFKDASSLTKVFVKATTVPGVDDASVFENVAAGFDIYVPEGAYSSYVNSDTPWENAYGSYIKSDKNLVSFDNTISESTVDGNRFEVHRQYILDGSTLILAREYVATYSGTTLVSMAETGSVKIGNSITDTAENKTYTITALGNNAFMKGAEYVSVELGFTITDYTFSNIASLKQLALTGIDLGNRGISGLALRKIIQDKDVASLAYDGSVTLDSLLDIQKNDDLTQIKEQLREIEIYEGVTSTVEGLLKYHVESEGNTYSFITSVKFPDGMLSIGVDSFEDTDWYKNYKGDFVVLGGVLYKYRGSGSTTVRIPASVTVINENAFTKTDGTKSIVSRISFESGSVAHTIRANAFKGCSALASINLPDSMVNIEPSAFDETAFTYTDNALMLKGDSDDLTLVKYNGSATEYVIPEAVTTISANAFKDNKNIKSVTFESDSRLTTIHEYAFYGCTNLSSVTLPETLSYIGKQALHETAWFNGKVSNGEDIIIHGVFYQKLTEKREFGITTNISSVTEGALTGTYNGKDVHVTSVVLENNAYIRASELYAILSDSHVTTFYSNGALTLAELIGTDEILQNITTLSFSSNSIGGNSYAICDGYADGWYSVTDVTGMTSHSIKSIGEYAFRGTAWYQNLTDEYAFAGTSGILIKYNGTGTELTIGSAVNSVRGITADVFRGNTTIESIKFHNESTLSEIPARAFEDCVNLASVTLPSTVTVFGKDAFKGTAWLESYESDYVVIGGALIAYLGDGGDVVIPDNVTKIYSYVFAGNENITSVTFSRYNLMTSIEADTFLGCTNLSSVTLSENIDNVDRTAFADTEWIQNTSTYLYYTDTYNGINRIVLYLGSASEVRIPSDVTEISANAFRGVTTMTTLIIPDNTKMTAIPANAFKNCTSLQIVTIPEAIKEIGEGAFEGTKWLTSSLASNGFVVVNGNLLGYKGSSSAVTVPDTVKVISKEAFRGITTITSIVIPDSVTSIEAYAFEGCTALSSITIGTGVTVIGDYAFNGTAWLDSQTDEFVIVNGILLAYNGSGAEVSLPTDVSYIGAGVFANNADITKITLSAEVTVGSSAFENSGLASVEGVQYILSACANSFEGTSYETSLLNNGYLVVNGALVAYSGTDADIVIPKDVTRIASDVFAGNINIVSVSFELIENAMTIESRAFENCVNLASVTLSENIASIGKRAFYNTAWLKNTNSDLIMTDGGKILAYVAEGTAVAIPAEATSIADGVFSGNQSIQSLSFDSKCQIDIPAYAFKGCSSLRTVTIPDSVKEIGEGAFEGTVWLTNESNKNSASKGYVVVRGKLIAYLGTSTEITIPSNVTYIYDYVFRGNTSITKLSFATGSRLSTIVGETFKGCTSLETVEFRSAMDYLDMGAFEGTPWSASQKAQGDFIVVGNKLLAYVGEGGDIVIPTSVDSFGTKVFAGNTTITSVTFADGSYVTVIPAETFAGCTSLTSVILPSEIADIGKDAFKDTPWLQSVIDNNGDQNKGTVENGAYISGGKALMYVGTESVFTMPQSVSYVSASFFVAGGITEIILTSDFVSSVTFASGALSTITAIWVPADLVTEYSMSEFWSNYNQIIKAIQG